MTVCISAICQTNVIIGAADRMLTAGDIEFEPVETPALITGAGAKIHPITNSIAIMMAGDAGLHWEIWLSARPAVEARIQKDPSTWVPVKEVADIYAHAYTEIRRQRAANVILAPLALNEMSFISKQKEMSKEFIENISKELLNFDMPPIEAIITGIDTAPHIYCVRNTYGGGACRIECFDSVGFAAVGIGARHAQSQFMLAGHNPGSSLSDTLLLTYSAKKRSEVAPGVGKATDMFAMGPQPGTFAFLGIPGNPVDLRAIDTIDNEIQQGERDLREKAKKKVSDYVDEITRPRTPQTQQSPSPDGKTTPSDGDGLSNDDKKGKAE